MANDDYIIYNFEAIDSAIGTYNQKSAEIAGLAERLGALVARVNEAMQSDAGTTCAAKVQELSQSVTAAQEALNQHITTLTGHLETARATEGGAQAIADGITVGFSME